MRSYAKIIVEQSAANHWSVWIDGTPQLSASGEWPQAAIERVFKLFGDLEFEPGEMWAIESTCTETREEYFLPFKRLTLMPTMSVN